MKDDFSELESMIYSGRGITMGMTTDGKPFVGYSLTGRSPSSQARKLVYDGTLKNIKIAVTDDKILSAGNPELLVYKAIQFIDDDRTKIVVSNGKQTDILERFAYLDEPLNAMHLLIRAHESKVIQHDAVNQQDIDLTSYEPDKPNFTPRISGCIDTKYTKSGFNNQLGAFYIVRKQPDSDLQDPGIHTFMLIPGQGHTVTTYKGNNENPLLPFQNKNPLFAEIRSSTAQDICESIYEAIGPKGDNNYRVAAAVMLLNGKNNLDVAIINRFDRGI